MKCTNCGFDLEQGARFCTACGTEAAETQAVSLNPMADKILLALKDNLFLIICILFSIGTAASLVNDGLPVINILLTIFLWLTYSKSRKNIADGTQLRNISGCVYANYVIMNVLAIIFIVCGVIFAFAFSLLSGSADFVNSFVSGFDEAIPGLNALPQAFLAVSGWVIGTVFLFVGVVCLVLNILGMKKVHLFAKSVYMTVNAQCTELENAKKVKGWLIFFAVCEGISALSALTTSVISAVSGGCICAVIILAIVLINKYLVKDEAI